MFHQQYLKQLKTEQLNYHYLNINMNRKTWISIFVIIVIIIAILLWMAFRKSADRGEKCPDGSPVPPSGKCPKSTSTEQPKPDASGCLQPSDYQTWSYPMGLGMKDSTYERVSELQDKLNTKYNAGLKTDGFFGCKTLAAVKKYLSTDKVDANNPIWNIPTQFLG